MIQKYSFALSVTGADLQEGQLLDEGPLSFYKNIGVLMGLVLIGLGFLLTLANGQTV
jgi:hypothetical protein